jgi:hypothetical protein
MEPNRYRGISRAILLVSAWVLVVTLLIAG